jgi:xanthine/CO dehydrogenase XdhC/CoxF family maturation factor
MTVRHLVTAFEKWSAAQQPLVLATVYETAGSTYSKSGAQMLINGQGDFQGMLSGGCLEGDLAERAREVILTGRPQTVTYNLAQNDEALWGLGVGCDGLMRIFLQMLSPQTAYEPFASMCAAYVGESVEAAVTVIESADELIPAGRTQVSVGGKAVYNDIGKTLEQHISSLAATVLAEGHSRAAVLEGPGGEFKLLVSILRPPPRLLVLGAGLDARPVVRLASLLGWRVVVQDHRPAYIAAGEFAEAEAVYCAPAEDLAATVDLLRIDAVIVMSHHLVTDGKYLRVLSGTGIPYIGLLGPVNRRDRLMGDLGDLAGTLRHRLHGPAGIDIGASGPASIAVSIIAQVHGQLSRRIAKH